MIGFCGLKDAGANWTRCVLEKKRMRDLQYMIDVMTAARDGKKIQFCVLSEGCWMDITGEASWNWRTKDYRIAPEPRKAREWDILISDTSALNANATWVRVREVLPEDKS